MTARARVAAPRPARGLKMKCSILIIKKARKRQVRAFVIRRRESESVIHNKEGEKVEGELDQRPTCLGHNIPAFYQLIMNKSRFQGIFKNDFRA